MIIDKNTVSQIGDYKFRNFISLIDSEKKTVWNWRNDESTRRLMYNKDFIPYENHLRFIDSLAERNDVAYWLIEKNDNPIGVVSLTDINFLKSSAELGYYMNPQCRNGGLGLEFVYHVLSFVFREICVNFLYGAMDTTNKNAIAVDTYMGCVLGNIISKGSDSTARFVEWTYERKNFLNNKEDKCDIRGFVNYLRKNKHITA